MISSISKNTIAQYSSSLKQWWEYCNKNKIDFYNFSVPSLLDFLTNCFNQGSSYGTLNSHRSAISLISSNSISENINLKRFFKGIFKLKPIFARYNVTWNPNVVLDFLEKLDNDKINLEMLSKKNCYVISTIHRTENTNNLFN